MGSSLIVCVMNIEESLLTAKKCSYHNTIRSNGKYANLAFFDMQVTDSQPYLSHTFLLWSTSILSPVYIISFSWSVPIILQSYFTIMKMSSVLFLLSCLLIEGVMSQTGLTATEEQEILNRHNILRGQVSPSSSNMERMV